MFRSLRSLIWLASGPVGPSALASLASHGSVLRRYTNAAPWGRAAGRTWGRSPLQHRNFAASRPERSPSQHRDFAASRPASSPLQQRGFAASRPGAPFAAAWLRRPRPGRCLCSSVASPSAAGALSFAVARLRRFAAEALPSAAPWLRRFASGALPFAVAQLRRFVAEALPSAAPWLRRFAAGALPFAAAWLRRPRPERSPLQWPDFAASWPGRSPLQQRGFAASRPRRSPQQHRGFAASRPAATRGATRPSRATRSS